MKLQEYYRVDINTYHFLMWASLVSAGKESFCNAGDPSSIPGSRISPGEGIGYLLQYSWASPSPR